jgi:PAS domain S-box-containing protein
MFFLRRQPEAQPCTIRYPISMSWLAAGALYSVGYLAAGWLLRELGATLLWFRVAALSVPPLVGIAVIARRRHQWTGCHWLFWATIALGLVMSAIGLAGWTLDELMLERETSWLGWHAVFALFGGIAPLFALLAQPHRGTREGVTSSTAVDIAGIAVMIGFLYSHFVIGSDMTPITASHAPMSLLILYEFQQFVVFAGLAIAAFVGRDTPWAPTYRRLAIGLLVFFAILTISNPQIAQGLYKSVFVYDVLWILPFAFFAWAASAAPTSEEAASEKEDGEATPSRPWVVFGSLCLVPIIDYGLRRVHPAGPLEGFREVFTAITIFSILPLLMARLAVERGDAQQADGKRKILAAATEQAEDLISIVTADGRMEHANAAFSRALGYERHEIARLNAADCIDDASLEAVIEAVRTAGVWRGTLRRRRRDGSTFPSASSWVALNDDHGRLVHLVAVEHDVTEETERREQMIHTERLAAVGQLASGVAHELNNPLQAIVGFTELLMTMERRDDARVDLDNIRSEANRAAKIIRNLLAFVRRSHGGRTPARMDDLVGATVALRKYELGNAGITLHEEYAAGDATALVSREEIQQVVLNLVLNAEQALAASTRGRELWVRTAVEDASVLIEIRDSGPGVPAALAGRVFEPFFTTKPVGQGTGLGLSIALGIAQSHQGTLRLVPTRLGACFQLALPLAAVEGAGPHPGDARPSTRRALVVDDETSMRASLQRMLNEGGFLVDTASGGPQALAMIEQNRYDLVVCDVNMPGGVALYDAVRERRLSAVRRFVFVSETALTAQLRTFVEAVQLPMLTKPVDAKRLEEAFELLIAHDASRNGVGSRLSAAS